MKDTIAMRFPAALAALIISAAPLAAEAAGPAPCLTASEFTALSSYALPSIISGASERCATVLPANAWLRQNGGQLAARYAQAKPAAWPRAKAAFLKVGGGSGNAEALDMIKSLPDTSLQPMVDALISGMIGQRLPTDRCSSVDRLVRLLSPLPPESTAELIAVAAGLGARTGQAKIGAFAICPA
jgi:hypothetical protein